MNITNLNLQYFKNYDAANIEFSSKLNCLLGLNGAGKTNILDAIHYLAFTKGAFNNIDNQNIKEGQPYMRIEGKFQFEDERKVLCFLERGQKKEFRFNDLSYEKISDHIGRVNVILHTPYDNELIRESSELRRKWVDGCISQYDHNYLEKLLKYQKVLKQRNAFLKSLEGRLDSSAAILLDTYDEQVVNLSKELCDSRNTFIEDFNPFFRRNLEYIIPENEHCTITYKTGVLQEVFAEKFRSSREKDLIMQRTTQGAHKDDYLFTLNEHPIKKFGSQGQQKSFLIALRLGQFDHLAARSSGKPILMLDDVFDKLDDNRIKQLVSLLNEEDRFGQIFITDARKERSLSIFADVSEKKLFEVIAGEISQL